MKKVLKVVILCFVLLSVVKNSYASSIDYRGNQSADYIRTLNRNAALDGADLVVYNPAGAAMLEDGIHVNGGLQFLFKTYWAEMEDGTEYESDYPSLFLPNLYGVYKQDNWAAFMGLHIPAGGGTVKYEEGIPLVDTLFGAAVDDQNLEAKSIYYGLTFGGAYAVNEMISLSLSARVIYATRKVEGEVNLLISPDPLKLDTEQTAWGYGAIIGVDIKPIEKLNIGIRYETKTKIELKAETTDNDLNFAQYDDGAEQRRDLPAVFGLGLAYDISDQIKLTTGLTYYFIKQADVDDEDEPTDAYSDDYDNGYDLSFGVEFLAMPELLLSVGYMWSDTGANEDTVSDFDNSLDSHNATLGAKYTVTQDVDLSLGFIYSKYIDIENAAETATFKKVVYGVAIGANAKF